MTTLREHARSCPLALAAWLATLLLGALAPAPARAQDAPPPASFTYRVERTLSGGSGAYEGYSDRLDAAGRYELASEGPSLRIGARYAWIYQGERCEEGVVERTVRASLPEREYVGQTDLDDYDDHTGPLAAWVWIPPTTPIGAGVRVLERDFQLAAREPVSVAGRDVPSLRVATAGTGRRDDAYGSFETSFTDTYWFDAATGYFLRSEYVERDVGSLDGAPAGFDWREAVEITSASYVPESVAPSLEIGSCGQRSFAPDGSGARDPDGVACLVVSFLVVAALLVGGLIQLVVRLSRTRRPVMVAGLPVQVVPVSVPADVPALGPADSPHFAPFLRHFAECAVRAGDPVFVARLADGRPVGLGLADREASIGSIFAKEPDACELLRQALGVTEFFTETRHEILPSVLGAAIEAKATQRPLAYNVYETYEVLELAPPVEVAYDAALVTRMSEADAKEVADLSATVHGVRGERWLAAALATGDLGFVARIDGRLVGYALVTVVGDRARLHTNTVHPDHRGRGIGKELTRARLGACAALGVLRAITEVATWNVASLEVVRALGFQVVGQMWVESAASVRIERKVVRR